MEHAWLDSLSEDWVSQPASDQSHSALVASLPTSVNRVNGSSLSKAKSSRIPRPNEWTGRDSNWTSADNSNVLSERSANDINIPRTQRTPSKLSHEIKHASRTVSASTAGSVVHNTVNHRI